MSSLSEPELSTMVNKILNELVPEFNVKVQNAILFMNIYLFLVILTAVISFINIILSVKLVRRIKGVYRNVDSNVDR